MDLNEKYSQLEDFNKEAELGGGIERIEKQHSAGKKTARERILQLLDPGTFNEIDKLVTHRSYDFGMDEKKILGDGLVAGYGKISGNWYMYLHRILPYLADH
jgi:propionyl-CoA carboxylase beta chain